MKNLQKKFEIKQIGDVRTLELYFYGEIQKDYYDWWTGELVESKTSSEYVKKALEDAGPVEQINIYINSIGGAISEGVAIYNLLKRNTAHKTVYIDAFAYSIASVIAMAGDKVVMPSNTTMMIHNASWGVYGNSAKLRKAADDLDAINEASCNTYLVKAGEKLPKEKLTELLDAETFLTAEQAFSYGLCDEIIDPVSLETAVEVVEQAQRQRNPAAKQAKENLQLTEQNKSPQKERTSFDIFKDIRSEKNYF